MNQDDTPSDGQRIMALEHVLYEIKMFVALPAVTDNELISNCLTEAFLLHARVLCDFFQKKRHKDDIVCEDYEFQRSSLHIDEDIEVRFDKCLAHVTYSRCRFTNDTKAWLLEHFRPPLLRRIAAFLEHLVSQSTLALKATDLADARATLQIVRAS